MRDMMPLTTSKVQVPSLRWPAEATDLLLGRLLIVTVIMMMIVMMTKAHNSECLLLSHMQRKTVIELAGTDGWPASCWNTRPTPATSAGSADREESV
jgi:hypothetical protein